MFSFMYWEITGAPAFDLPFSLISWLAISGTITMAIRSQLFGRKW